MTVQNEVVVHYADGYAEAIVGGRTIKVAAHDDANRNTLCPVELVSAALGT